MEKDIPDPMVFRKNTDERPEGFSVEKLTSSQDVAL